MTDNKLVPSDNTNLPIDPTKINTELQSLTQQIVDSDSPSQSQDLLASFNWAMTKKGALRLAKLGSIYDNITDQMLERVTKRSGEFSTTDLLNYMQAVETSMEKTQKTMNAPENQPAIQVQNNTQVNIGGVFGLDADSKDKISNAIRLALQASMENSEPTIEISPEDAVVEPDENTNDNQ